MALIPRDSPVPPGGFHFIDKSGGAEVRIDGSGYADVADRILKHRLMNKRPMGNPLQELYDFVCSQWPHVCTETHPPAFVHAGRPEHISRRVDAWLSAYLSTSGVDNGVDQGEANRRASICAHCPKNEAYEVGVSCQSCVGHTNELSFVYRRHRTTPDDKALQGCAVLGEHLRSSVWATKLPCLSEEQKQNVPEHCWRKAI